MQIQPIINYYNNNFNNNKNTFTAKLSADDLRLVIQEIQQSGCAENLPKAYTYLEYLNEIPERMAHFSQYNGNTSWTDMFCGLFVHYKELASEKLYSKHQQPSYLNILHNACVESEGTKSHYVRMPQSVFEQKWWENRHKTVADLITEFTFPSDNH